MESTLAEVLEAARALPRTERAEVAHELIATLEVTNEDHQRQYEELRAAVDLGLRELDRDEGIDVPAGSLGDYMRELRLTAIDRAVRRTA